MQTSRISSFGDGIPVDNLFFIYHSEYRIPELFSYIEKLLRRRGQLDLNKFELDIPYDFGIDKRVNNWIRYAFSCNVKDLDLEFVSGYEPYHSEFVLEQFFFINSSVTHMKLNGCVLKPTGAIRWSNLKSLCIVRGNLAEKLIENILSGSPLLETLKLKDCEGFLEINITSKNVKNLVFSGYTDKMECFFPFVVKINAPHILSLTIKEELKLGKLVLLNVSSLVEAELNYYYKRDEPASEDESDEPANEKDIDFPTTWKKREEILKGLILSLQHVKNFTIGHHCLETLAPLEAKGFTCPFDWSDNDSED